MIPIFSIRLLLPTNDWLIILFCIRKISRNSIATPVLHHKCQRWFLFVLLQIRFICFSIVWVINSQFVQPNTKKVTVNIIFRPTTFILKDQKYESHFYDLFLDENHAYFIFKYKQMAIFVCGPYVCGTKHFTMCDWMMSSRWLRTFEIAIFWGVGNWENTIWKYSYSIRFFLLL